MSALFGGSHLTRERRPTLTVKRRPNAQLGGGEQKRSFTEKLDDLQLWEADLWVAFRRFRHRRNQAGLFGSRKLKRRDADLALALALREAALGGVA